MLKHLSYALDNQLDFIQITFNGENMDLEYFELDLDYIDRLYYLYHNDQEKHHFHVICRMVYNTEPVFVELFAKCCNVRGFQCLSLGYIFVTKNPNTLFRVFLANHCYKRDAILDSLRSDGYLVETEDTLVFHIFDTIFKHLECFENYYPEVLPEILKNRVDEFIYVQKCKDVYDKEKSKYNNYIIKDHAIGLPIPAGIYNTELELGNIRYVVREGEGGIFFRLFIFLATLFIRVIPFGSYRRIQLFFFDE